LLSIDVGVNYKGAISDAAASLIVGGEQHNPRWAELVKTTKKALDEGLKQVKMGRLFWDFSTKVWEIVRNRGFSIVKNLTGHSVW